jgi:hypothetical protein
MVHLRIVVPTDRADAILALLESCRSVINIVHLEGVARKPDGDVVLCDVAREDASVVIADLRHLGVPDYGSISIDDIDSSLSRAADEAEADDFGHRLAAAFRPFVSGRGCGARPGTVQRTLGYRGGGAR